MATITTATVNFNQTVVALVQKRLEELLRYPLVHLIPGNFRPAQFVKGTNNTMRFVSFADVPADAAAGLATPVAGTAPWLTEGVAPASIDLAIQYEEFTANQAGRVIQLTDVAMLESPFDLLSVAADRVARDALRVADQRTAQVILAGTNYITANTARPTTATVAAGDLLTGASVKRAVAKLKGASVPMFPDGTYHAIIHPYVVNDLQADVDVGGWMDASRYAGAEQLLTGELGRYAGVRFSDSAGAGVKAGAGAAAIDVYSTVFFGPEAYAFGDWGQIETHVTPPGGHTDPLYQSALVGWKAFFGAKLITNASAGPRYIRDESATGTV